MYRIVLCVFVISGRYADVSTAQSARGCYGEELTLACKPDARINVLRDFLGYATGSGCRLRDDADCTLSVSPHESAARRRCNGLSECTLAVEQRAACPSGAGRTNYHQVDFECIPDIYLNDVCHSKQWEAEGAYLVSPGYPSRFPGRTDCLCSVGAADPSAAAAASSSPVHVLTLDFDVESTGPSCKRWVAFDVDGRETKLCGRFTRRFSGTALTVRFHSETSARRGFLLYAYGRPTSTKLKFRCGTQNDHSVDVVHGEDALFAARRMSMGVGPAPPPPGRPTGSLARGFDGARMWTSDAGPRIRTAGVRRGGADPSGSADRDVDAAGFGRTLAPGERRSPDPRSDARKATARGGPPPPPRPAVSPAVRLTSGAPAAAGDGAAVVESLSRDLLLVHGRLSFDANGRTAAAAAAAAGKPPKIVSACFGSTLNLSCGRGEVIRILDNFYGNNAHGRCSYAKDGCFRRPRSGLGIAEQTCNTEPSCADLQVVRVMCGEGYTNYQQIAYECIPADIFLDISTSFSGVSSSGYLISGGFPGFSSLPASASCTLSAGYGKVRLQVVHLQLYEDGTCSNWLELRIADKRTTYCRPGSGTFVGEKIELSYQTDGRKSSSGVWLYFDALDSPEVTVTCNADGAEPPSRRLPFAVNATSAPPTTPPSGGLRGRPSSVEADVFGHVPAEFSEAGPASSRSAPTGRRRPSAHGAVTSTVSPLSAWDGSARGETTGARKTSRASVRERGDRTFDGVVDGTTRRSDEVASSADHAGGDVSSADYAVAGSEAPPAYPSYDFYQYQAPDGSTDRLVSEVLEELFGEHPLGDLLSNLSLADLVAGDSEPVTPTRLTGGVDPEGVTKTPPRPSQESRPTAGSPPMSTMMIESGASATPSATDPKKTNRAHETGVHEAGHTGGPSGIEENILENSADVTKSESSNGSESSVGGDGVEKATNGIHGEERLTGTNGLWDDYDTDHHGVGQDDKDPNNIERHADHGGATTAELDDVTTIVYDVTAASKAVKLHSLKDTVRWQYYALICVLYFAVTK